MYWGYAFEAMATERNAVEDDQEFVDAECVDAASALSLVRIPRISETFYINSKASFPIHLVSE